MFMSCSEYYNHAFHKSGTNTKHRHIHAPATAAPVSTSSPPRSLWPPHNMEDIDVFAAMGIAGFGKAPKKKTVKVDSSTFAKTKRVRYVDNNR